MAEAPCVMHLNLPKEFGLSLQSFLGPSFVRSYRTVLVQETNIYEYPDDIREEIPRQWFL